MPQQPPQQQPALLSRHASTVHSLQHVLAEVEALEVRAHSGHGPPLDAQQVVKVSQKAALLEALHALEVGVPLESVQQMLAHAQEVAARLAGLPVGASPPSSTTTSTNLASKRGRAGAPGLEISSGPSAGAGAGAGAGVAQPGTAKKSGADKRGERQQASHAEGGTADAASMGVGSLDAATAAYGAPGTSRGEGGGVGGRSEGFSKAAGPKEARPQARKGDLSMFLAGALDKKKPPPQALPPRPAGQPAWGGAALLPPPTPSPFLQPTPETQTKQALAQLRNINPGGGTTPASAAASMATTTGAAAGGAAAAAAPAAADAATSAELDRALMPPPTGPRPPPSRGAHPGPVTSQQPATAPQPTTARPKAAAAAALQPPAAAPQPTPAWPKAAAQAPAPPAPPPALTSAAGPFPSVIAGGAPQPIAVAKGFPSAGVGGAGPIAAAAAAGGMFGAGGGTGSQISAAVRGASPVRGVSKDVFATPPPKKGPTRAEPDATPSPMSLLFTPLPQPPTPAGPAPQNTGNEPVKFSLAEFMAGPGAQAGMGVCRCVVGWVERKVDVFFGRV
ncbi:hypothetical protein DUNSADRAFT_932 [Dunaliella salina]|uniref:Uncharacterized protein n=1 Tax=Dunaliella salina TaxID=3046 RepID=A0ABQ7H8S2_DUNSA|nr:hypothetical protein DUNSADRAFT_932 [Dunaliella salina]|eukprot:KAF5843256.1 hypothetical protein DUNSADRAFT_932 [Dunaliella salina]